MNPPSATEQEARFWSFVDKSAGTDACWIWTGRTNDKGYGRFFTGGKTVRAHRFAFLITFRAIHDGLQVCHACDNPPCVNPMHLFPGTNLDNVKDREAKGRGKRFYGLENGWAKIADADVVRIKQMSKSGMRQAKIANIFGISASHVSMIVSGRRRNNLMASKHILPTTQPS